MGGFPPSKITVPRRPTLTGMEDPNVVAVRTGSIRGAGWGKYFEQVKADDQRRRREEAAGGGGTGGGGGASAAAEQRQKSRCGPIAVRTMNTNPHAEKTHPTSCCVFKRARK